MKKLNYLILGLFAAVVLISCKKDDEPQEEEVPEVTSGMVIGCEGSFLANNASIHILFDDGVLNKNVFSNENGATPGDVLQSYREFLGRGYAVVNNSQKVEMVNVVDMSRITSITGCDYPRDVLVLTDTKGYITNGFDNGELLVFNPFNGQITGSIAIDAGPEEVVANNDYVFVANRGGTSNGNTVTVIDPLTDQIVSTVTVGDRPISLEVDYQGNVWVLCQGDVIYDANWNVIGETEAQLMRVDGQAHAVTAQWTIGEVGEHPQFMAISPDGQDLYLVNGDVLFYDIAAGQFQTQTIEGDFYAIGVNEATGEILVSSMPDYVNNDQVFEYTAGGQLNATYTVGVAPRAFHYRP